MYPRRAPRRDRRFVLPFGLEDFPEIVGDRELAEMIHNRINGGMVRLLGHATSPTRTSPPRVPPPPRGRGAPVETAPGRSLRIRTVDGVGVEQEEDEYEKEYEFDEQEKDTQ